MMDQNSESILELNKFVFYQKQHSTSIIEEEADEASSNSSKGFFRPTDIHTPEVSGELVTPLSSTHHEFYREEVDWRYSDSIQTPRVDTCEENLSPSPVKWSKKSYHKTNSMRTLRDCPSTTDFSLNSYSTTVIKKNQ
jgi:hypothetical protein